MDGNAGDLQFGDIGMVSLASRLERSSPPPPSFAQSQLDTLLVRWQQNRPPSGGIKYTNRPTRFTNLSDDWEFAGWGSTKSLELKPSDQPSLTVGERNLGKFIASAVAGNAVLGGVFYAFPAVVAVCGVYAPIVLFVSSILLVLWKPVMEELASAFPVDGVNYVYLLNVSSKSVAIFAAALTLLDSAVIPLVSAATATNYLAGEIPSGAAGIPFPPYFLVAMIIVLFVSLSMAGLKDSARMAFVILCFHMFTMVVLMTAGIVHWIRAGNARLTQNWTSYHHGSAANTVSQIFKGTCVAFLGLTGFECAPSNISSVKRGAYSSVLRNILIAATLLNAPLMLIVLAVVPFGQMLSGGNVLSIMASICAGRWLRLWVVIDALLALCAAIFTGILSGSALIIKLSDDGVLPKAMSKSIKLTRAPHLAIGAFLLLDVLIYAISTADLQLLSQIFSMTFLASMLLFPISALLLKFQRGRLPRSPKASLSRVITTSLLGIVLIAGNVAISPLALRSFAIYLFVIFSAYDQMTLLHRLPWTKDWDIRMINTIRRKKKSAIAILVKTDEIDHLFKVIDYVRRNEETSSIKLVHFSEDAHGDPIIPPELDANAKILDEAFPQITIDLINVQAPFSPNNVLRVSTKIGIPPSQFFMSCPGNDSRGHFVDFGGARIITL